MFGDFYMEVIQKDNVDVYFIVVVSCIEDGVVGVDGVECKVDMVVCVIGYDNIYWFLFLVVGKNGVDLKDKWVIVFEFYFGLVVFDMFNFMIFIGLIWFI